MNNFDKLQVGSLKNDGLQYWKEGIQDYARYGYSYGTQAGGGFHQIEIYPHMIPNCYHVHIFGNLVGTDLSIRLSEGLDYPEYWDTKYLDGKELFITTRTANLSPGNTITLYWGALSGPVKLDEISVGTYKSHGILVNWFDGAAYASHIYSRNP